MQPVIADEETNASETVGKLLSRKDLLLLAAGSIPCIREIGQLAEALGKRGQFHYVKTHEIDYILGAAEGKILEEIRKTAEESGAKVIVLYLSCLDILIRLDFKALEEEASRETGAVVRCFFRGPLGKEEEGALDADAFLKTLPPEGPPMKPLTPQLPPPVADLAGISDWCDRKGNANILLTPSGCRSCMADGDMRKEQENVFYTTIEGKDITMGMEEPIRSQVASWEKEHPGWSCALMNSAVPAFMGVNENSIGFTPEERKKLLFFDASGFQGASAGVSRSELTLVRSRAGEKPDRKGKRILVLGYSSLLCGSREQYKECLDFLEKEKWEVLWAGRDEWKGVPDLAWVVSAAGLPAGHWLNQVMGIPLVIACPLGDHAMESWKKNVRDLEKAGQGERELKIHNMSLPRTRSEKVLFVGDPVQMMAAAHYLRHKGFFRLRLAAYLWTGEDRKLDRTAPGCGNISFVETAGDLRKEAEEADVLVGDPHFFEPFPDKKKIALPWGVISGRQACGKGSGLLDPSFKEKLDLL